MSPGGPIPVTGAAVRVGDVGGPVVEALRQRDLSVRARVPLSHTGYLRASDRQRVLHSFTPTLLAVPPSHKGRC